MPASAGSKLLYFLKDKLGSKQVLTPHVSCLTGRYMKVCYHYSQHCSVCLWDCIVALKSWCDMKGSRPQWWQGLSLGDRIRGRAFFLFFHFFIIFFSSLCVRIYCCCDGKACVCNPCVISTPCPGWEDRDTEQQPFTWAAPGQLCCKRYGHFSPAAKELRRLDVKWIIAGELNPCLIQFCILRLINLSSKIK